MIQNNFGFFIRAVVMFVLIFSGVGSSGPGLLNWPKNDPINSSVWALNIMIAPLWED